MSDLLLAGVHGQAEEAELALAWLGDDEALVDVGAVEPDPADRAAVVVRPVEVPGVDRGNGYRRAGTGNRA
jgi:hypothetical protein